MNFDLRYFLSICWRRLPIFLPVSMLMSVIAFMVAVSLPAKYDSSATLLVESAQISDNLAESTVSVDPNEQLQIVQQRLMTRANLLQIAREFDVLPNEDMLSADEIVEDMREQTDIRVTSGRDLATQMTLKFTAEKPQVAASVLNEYITLMLNTSSEFRKSRAEDTLEFFQQEVDRLSTNLDEQSARIMTFQSENSDALPSTLSYRLARQGQLQERMARAEQERLSLNDQKIRMVQIFEMTSGTQNAQQPISPKQRELAALETELKQALLIYSTENPRVKLLQSRVDLLAEEVAAEAASEDSPDSRQEALIELQVQEIDQRVAALGEQIISIQSELEVLQDTIERTPANEISLEALQREYSILENQYNGSVARLNAASTGERIEVLSKGERITIIEQPNIATEPSSPNRPLIAAAGSFGGMIFAIMIILIVEFLNKAIRRPYDLSNRFGITPLAVLPVIRTPGDRILKGAALLLAVSVVVIGVPAALFAVHTYYLPLDLIVDRTIARLGL